MIPEKSYIPATIPKGTTLEQWKRYEADMIRHEETYSKNKPERIEFVNDSEYKGALSQWRMDYACFEPNKPGYTQANND